MKTVAELIKELSAYPENAVVKRAEITIHTANLASKYTYSERLAKKLAALQKALA